MATDPASVSKSESVNAPESLADFLSYIISGSHFEVYWRYGYICNVACKVDDYGNERWVASPGWNKSENLKLELYYSRFYGSRREEAVAGLIRNLYPELWNDRIKFWANKEPL